ncbi:MAG: hypothetical protein D6751_11910 [Deltaproteobacteria bacterium]|nr:MAG: hypothetical protein D6751_11910 [Deltaproteobacteria bacterium]
MLLSLGLAFQAEAVGFGSPVLRSHLEEPLDVQLPLELSEGESLSRVFVDLGTPQEYRQLGLQPFSDLSDIRISVRKSSRGGIVQLRSDRPMQQPVLSLLLKARSGHSTYFKHFQLLLDPLHARPLQPASSVRRASPPKLATTVVRTSAESTEAGKGQAEGPSEGRGFAGGWARTNRYGPVRGGDSLSEIAYRLRKDKRFSNAQVMLALYELNPEAFIGGDINRLKSGAWLRIPDAGLVRRHSSRSARRQLKKLMRLAPMASPNGGAGLRPGKQPALPHSSPDHGGSALRFSGKIALGDAEALSAAAKAERERREALWREQFQKLHDQAMKSQLRLDQTNKSLQRIEGYVQQLQKDVADLRKQLEAGNQARKANAIWLIAFVVLLLFNFGILIGVFYQRRAQQRLPVPTVDPAGSDAFHARISQASKQREKSSSATRTSSSPAQSPKGKAESKEDAGTSDPFVPVMSTDRTPQKKKDADRTRIEALIHEIEEDMHASRLNEVEPKLDELDAISPGNLRAAAMRAEWLHRLDRIAERDRLIDSMKEQLTEKKWMLFSRILHAEIWQEWQSGESMAATLVDPAEPEHGRAEEAGESKSEALEMDLSDFALPEQEATDPLTMSGSDFESHFLDDPFEEDPFGQTVVIQPRKKDQG